MVDFVVTVFAISPCSVCYMLDFGAMVPAISPCSLCYMLDFGEQLLHVRVGTPCLESYIGLCTP